jgi:hypothetical protein
MVNMTSFFYKAGQYAALTKLGIGESGDMPGVDTRAGVLMGHQEDSESDQQLRPRHVKPPTTASTGAQKVQGTSDSVNYAFDSLDAIKPREPNQAPHTEYIGGSMS